MNNEADENHLIYILSDCTKKLFTSIVTSENGNSQAWLLIRFVNPITSALIGHDSVLRWDHLKSSSWHGTQCKLRKQTCKRKRKYRILRGSFTCYIYMILQFLSIQNACILLLYFCPCIPQWWNFSIIAWPNGKVERNHFDHAITLSMRNNNDVTRYISIYQSFLTTWFWNIILLSETLLFFYHYLNYYLMQ